MDRSFIIHRSSFIISARPQHRSNQPGLPAQKLLDRHRALPGQLHFAQLQHAGACHHTRATPAQWDHLPDAPAGRGLAALVAHEGVTVFLTTHNLAEAEKLCHQIGIIRQGKLIASGAPTELRAQAGKPSLEIVARGLDQTVIAYLKDRPEVETVQINGNRLVIHLKEPIPSAPLVTYLVSKGIEVEEVVKSQTSLEEVFLNLMEEDETKAEAD